MTERGGRQKRNDTGSSIKDVGNDRRGVEDDRGGGKTKEERHWIPSLTGSPIRSGASVEDDRRGSRG